HHQLLGGSGQREGQRAVPGQTGVLCMDCSRCGQQAGRADGQSCQHLPRGGPLSWSRPVLMVTHNAHHCLDTRTVMWVERNSTRSEVSSPFMSRISMFSNVHFGTFRLKDCSGICKSLTMVLTIRVRSSASSMV